MENDYSDISEKHHPPRSKHMKVMITIICCILVIFIGIGVFYLCKWIHIKNSNSHASLTLFSDGMLLYYTAIEDENKLYSYDPDAKKNHLVIDEPVNEFYTNLDYYFYSNENGFYSLHKTTKEKYKIADNGHYMTEDNGMLYFVYCKNEHIREDEHTVIGCDKSVILYQYDIAKKERTEIKSQYHKDDYLATPYQSKENQDYVDTNRYKDVSIQDLHIINDRLYYRNDTTVYSLSLDGKDEQLIYQSKNNILRIDWIEGGFYSFESHMEQPQHYLNFYDLNTGKILIQTTEFNCFSDILYFDTSAKLFYTIKDNKLTSLSFDAPQNIVVCDIIPSTNYPIFNLIKVKDSLYLSEYDGISHNEHDYLITKIERGKTVPFIKNGKIISK